ncbi:hypothetical protein L1987_04152 [Smallanthus sonchifolius]|uniref:Uncharacterized protein n=1 Tax=Smallanthus sonchifolius TaxID=185202 RepID=A0ACB9KCT8_9ASTR|nr:hypothetical protein L1987_04152 [Smallanthus sonchifolius]
MRNEVHKSVASRGLIGIMAQMLVCGLIVAFNGGFRYFHLGISLCLSESIFRKSLVWCEEDGWLRVDVGEEGKCVESAANSKRLLYGCFILSPLMKGQADTIGIAMRRASLGEIEGTCIIFVLEFESNRLACV